MFLEAELDEKTALLNEEVKFFGSYAGAVNVETGMEPPAYEKIQPATEIVSRPVSPPSTTLISVYSEPIRVEYEENERIHRAGCGNLLWNYFACYGYINEYLIERFSDTNSRLCWTILGCFCCIIPLLVLLIIYLSV